MKSEDEAKRHKSLCSDHNGPLPLSVICSAPAKDIPNVFFTFNMGQLNPQKRIRFYREIANLINQTTCEHSHIAGACKQRGLGSVGSTLLLSSCNMYWTLTSISCVLQNGAL